MEQNAIEPPEPDSIDNTDNAQNATIKNYHLTKAKLCLKIALIISAVLAIIVIILLIISGGETSEGNGKGAIWWVLIPAAPFIYAIPILLLVSLIHAILYHRDKKANNNLGR